LSSDAELVEAARRGDAASLGLLLERYRAPLYGLSLRILGHGSEARDAVHDTFLIALRRIDELREPSAVGGWLHAVLRNARRMRLRADQGELPSGSRLATSPGAPRAVRRRVHRPAGSTREGVALRPRIERLGRPHR
jgi:DNA-directed RNA polymerase specialized sigma24 family protein